MTQTGSMGLISAANLRGTPGRNGIFGAFPALDKAERRASAVSF
jgi:hypothetical protein